MEKSGKVIECEAYVRYLRKVTGRPSDPEHIRAAVMVQAVERTEMQTAWMLMRKLVSVVGIVLILAFGTALLGYFHGRPEFPEENVRWNESRTEKDEYSGRLRLYEAYKHSSSIRNLNK